MSGLTIASSTLNSDLYERQTPSFFSRFYINADSRNGLTAVHVYQNNLVNGKGTSEKHTFSLGVLSPASGGTNGDGVNVCEPSALLLTSESVLYPFLDSVSEGKPLHSLLSCTELNLFASHFSRCSHR